MKKVLISVTFIFLLIAANGCTTINKLRSTSPVPISGAVEVGPEWVEIYPPNPLISRAGTRQEVRVYTQHQVQGDFGKDWKTLSVNDKKKTKIETILYDENGNEFELFINGDAGDYISLALTSPQSEKMVRFPDGKYTKLKIRSEFPIKIEKIDWRADYPIDDMF